MINQTRLVVLGMLFQSPMHGYEIQRILEDSFASNWSGIAAGSIYHALKSLDKGGFVQVKTTEKDGFRTRAIYEITDAGRDELRSLQEAAWGEVPHSIPSTLYIAASFAGILPPEKAIERIDEAIKKLEAELSLWEFGEEMKTGDNRRVNLIRVIFENGRQHLKTDLNLLKEIKLILREGVTLAAD